MRLLLDTHVVLWALTDHPALSTQARALIEDERNSVWVSAVSIWEVSIKHSIGRGDMPLSGPDCIRFCREAGYSWLNVSPEHAAAIENLPALHTDPFDRLLIAQAFAEPMNLMTHDPVMASYSSNILLV